MKSGHIFVAAFIWNFHILTHALNKLKYSISEEMPAGTLVGNVATSKYANQTFLKNLRYSFLTQGNSHVKYFRIGQKTGAIHTYAVIDRENVCPEKIECILELGVAVTSTVDLSFVDVTKVAVNIIDQNDNAPIFSGESEIAITILESAAVNTEFFISSAEDLDMDERNSIQTYELLSDQDIFGLKVDKTGVGQFDFGIILKQTLDHEDQNFYQLRIVAKDGGVPERSGFLTVNITVLDTNDNRPEFGKKEYTVSIQENLPLGSSVVQVSAVDVDSGLNGKLGYRFSSRTSSLVKKLFTINETTGLIVVNGQIDYEDQSRHSFRVECFDYGVPPLKSSAMVIVNVKDINDNRPQININLLKLGYATNESEFASLGTFIAHVSIVDKDSGQNGNATCSVNDPHFELQLISKNTFKAVVSEKLDYEKQSVHNVTISCNDRGTPVLRNSKSFLIFIKDENDNAPKFKSSAISETLFENNEQNEFITKVTAVDADTGVNAKIHYVLSHGAGHRFKIDRKNGVIKTNSTFDREAAAIIPFKVLAIDGGQPSLTGTVTVSLTILDKNDNPPTFLKPEFRFHVQENMPEFTPVGQLDVVDHDFGANAEIRFWISQSFPANKMFTVIDGILKTTSVLNREMQKKYEFVVVAADYGNKKPLSSSAKVTVFVGDTNDNYPFFIFPNSSNSTLTIPLDQTKLPGKPITTIRAHDLDSGENATLSYFLHEERAGKPMFQINKNTGDIFMLEMKNTKVTGSYKILVTVQDHGVAPKKNETSLTILVTEGNSSEVAFGMQNSSRKNLTIVIVLSAVTFVLATCIILTIFVIRKLDRNRRCYSTKQQEREAREKRMQKADCEGQKNKKEVSFTFDELQERGSTISLTNASPVKSPPACFAFSSEQQQNIQNAPGSGLTDSPISKEGHHLETFTGKDYLMSSPSSYTDTLPLSPCSAWSKEHKQSLPEDSNSENSGETAASDSGRGGSEDDVHLMRSSFHGQPGSGLKNSKTFYDNEPTGSTGGRHLLSLRTFRPDGYHRGYTADSPGSASSSPPMSNKAAGPFSSKTSQRQPLKSEACSPQLSKAGHGGSSTNLTGLKYSVTGKNDRQPSCQNKATENTYRFHHL